ncbi:MAG: type II toxin-antitoxin system VapC family toxin [Bosea sp. (in: a-proteobacteria)]
MAEFASGSRLYIDSNIWVYFIEANPLFVEAVRQLFLQAEAAGARLVTSEIAIAECLYKPAKDGNTLALAAYDLLFGSGEIEIIPVDGALARSAALHGGMLGLKLIDAMHYLGALESGCDIFVTADAQFRSGPQMRVTILEA